MLFCINFNLTPFTHKYDALKKIKSNSIFFKVECKKAQPKEVVQAANTAALLGKRVILSNLGILPGLNLPSMGPTTPTPAAAAAIPQISQQQPQLTASHTALQAALQQQLAASAALGIFT